MKALSVCALSLLTAWTGIARAEVIRGTVLEDHSGSAVLGASVRLKTLTGTTVREMDTDRNGGFEFPDLAAGVYQLSIAKANYASLNARMATTTASPVLRLIKYGVISGHITSPGRNATVIVIEQVPKNQIPLTYSGRIDAAGDFRIFGIPPGRYVLAALFTSANTVPGAFRGIATYPTGARPREFEIAGGEQYEVSDFIVQPAATSTISGRISSPAGPQTYTLAMVPTGYPLIRALSTRTAMDGTFELDNIHPGSYELYASGPVMPPSFFAHVHLDLHSQNVENLDLSLQPGLRAEFMLSPDPPHPACSADGTLILESLALWPLVRDRKITTPIRPQQASIENVGPSPFIVSVQSTTGGCTGVTERIFDMTDNVPPQRMIMGFQPPGVIHGGAAAGGVVILRDVTPGREAPLQAVFPNSPEFRFESLAPGLYCVVKRSAIDTTLRWTSESACGESVIDLAPSESKGL